MSGKEKGITFSKTVSLKIHNIRNGNGFSSFHNFVKSSYIFKLHLIYKMFYIPSYFHHKKIETSLLT